MNTAPTSPEASGSAWPRAQRQDWLDALRERIKGNALLVEAYGRMGEHLVANGVDAAKTPLTLGVPLQLAPGKEAFVGEFAAQATPMLTRQYRAPFAVPALA